MAITPDDRVHPRPHHNQPPPLEDFNRYAGNQALRDALAREGAGWADSELLAAGAELGSAEWISRGDLANRYPPRLHVLDRRGERRDAFEFHPAWHQCLHWIKAQGLAGASWTDHRPGAQVRRAALFQLFAEVECGSLCPATMTQGAVSVLARSGDGFFDEPWLRLLRAPVYDERFVPAGEKRGLLMGMGLTERQGGSDVRANSTRAVPRGDGWFRLDGHKWFFSAAMCDAFLVTALSADGLDCFFLPRFGPDGEPNGIHLVRAKDKLGDRSNASAEVEFHGALARRVGEPGRGLATVLDMANHTRLDCANGSAGLMRAALAEALHVARHRRAFGKPLIEQPLMANVLADMVLEVEGHIALCLRVAACLDARERDGSAALLARLLIPVAKYWVCQRAPPVVAEAMQAVGGNGYVEDGPLPRLYRQAPLNAIWEGAGNIVCLDVLRVLAREPEAAPLLIRWLGGYRGIVAAYDHALDGLEALLQAPEPAGARHLCEAIALQAQGALLLGDGPSPHALAFGASRLGNPGGHCLGTLPFDSDFPGLIARALPDASFGKSGP